MRTLADIRLKSGINFKFSPVNENSANGESSIPLIDADSNESDTDVTRTRPDTCLLLTRIHARGKDRFSIRYFENGILRAEAKFKGNADYLRRVILFPDQQLLVFSYASQTRSYHDAALMLVDLKAGTYKELIVR